MLASVNNGFSEGRVTKQDLVAWLINRFPLGRFEKSIPAIRDAHRDPILVLQAKIAELRANRRINSSS
jgi:hypothetical protein